MPLYLLFMCGAIVLFMKTKLARFTPQKLTSFARKFDNFVNSGWLVVNKINDKVKMNRFSMSEVTKVGLPRILEIFRPW